VSGTEPHHRRGGISLQTLIVASIASAAASFAVSRIWGPGTLISAAATPIIVALVSEFLRKPVETVASTAKRVPGQRGAWTAAPAEPAGPAEPGQPRLREEEPTAVAAAPAPSSISRVHVGTAIATGLAAFAIVVAFFTLPDLVTGRSITGNGDSTTFFGGDEKPRRTTTVQEEPVTVPAETVTTPPPVTVTVPAPDATAAPPPTTDATPAPTATATPAPTVTPPAATPTATPAP
jgi:hypothetical protein